jgi:TonB family protein
MGAVMQKIILCCAAVLGCCGLSAPQPRHLVGVQRLLVPDYPRVAHLAQVAGDVRLTVVVEPNGRVSSVKSASGVPILVQHATANILRWSYTPFDARTEFDVVYAYRLVGPRVDADTPPTVELETPFRIVITARLLAPPGY